jgi:transcriptional regulator with XRE-family HTH domain
MEKGERENMSNGIGMKIRELRAKSNITLEELKSRTQFSIGFLSQLERGLTTVAVDALSKIAKALGVDVNYFFPTPKSQNKIIVRSFERDIIRDENNSHFIFYLLSGDSARRELLPRIVEILPVNGNDEVALYPHQGEEMIFVLEGILTLARTSGTDDLYPGDCAHYSSEEPHNWINRTNRKVSFLVVNTPNPFKEK